MALPDYGLACGAISITGNPDTIRNLDQQGGTACLSRSCNKCWGKPMVKYYLDGVAVKDTRETAEPSPAMVDYIESYNARQKSLLDEWIRYLAQQRAREDAKGAVKGFIAICVLVAIAVSFLISF